MYPLAKPSFIGNEIKYVEECLNSGWIAHGGPFSEKFKNSIKKFTQTNYALLTASCTASLHTALLALGIKAGDEVIVSDFTFPATGHTVKMCGAEPIFADVEEDTYNINPDLIEGLITKNTRAIIPVHLFGSPCKIEKIMSIAKKYNLAVVEDCACSLGAFVKDKHVGTFGNIGAFSLHARKGITTGEGGISICNDKILSEKIEKYSLFGMERILEQGLLKCKFTDLGFNYKFSDLQAAVGLAQIEEIQKYIKRRCELADYYIEFLSRIVDIFPPIKSIGQVWQSFVVRVNSNINRDKLILNLLKEGVQTQIGTYASHLEPVYNSSQSCPASATLFKNTLALPFYFELQNSDIEKIIIILKKCIQRSKC